MSATQPIPLAGTGSITGSARRVAWLAVGLAAVGLALFVAARQEVGLAPFIFLILPDLAFVAGLGEPHQPRQLPTRSVPLYNLLHRPLLPLTMLAIGIVAGLGPAFIAGGFLWLAHIALDRAAGYGQRTPDGWQRV